MRSLLVFATLVFASPTLAGNDSVYTDLDLKRCTQVSPAAAEGEGDFSGTYECAGYGNYVVTYAEDDLRSLVSFGTESGDHCAFRQTFGGFNSVGKKIEWRRKDGKALATILRWTVSYDPEDSSKTKTWLVVTKLEPEDSCHMGYVEGSFPNANAAARKLADSMSVGFSCKTSKPTIIAYAGTATDNIAANDGC